jgi:ATP-binding cassette subfamily B protein
MGLPKKTKLPSSLTPFILHFLCKQPILLFILVISSLGPTLDSVIWPVIISYIIDNLNDNLTYYQGDKTHIWESIGLTVYTGALFWVIIEVMFRIFGYTYACLIPKFTGDIRVAMFDYATQHSHSFFVTSFSGSMSNKVNEMAVTCERIVRDLLSSIIPTILTSFLFIVYFASMHWTISACVLAWVFTHSIIMIVGAKNAANFSQIHSKSRSSLIGKIVDTFSNISTVRSYARRKNEVVYVSNAQKDEIKKRQELLFRVENNKFILGFNCFIFLGVMLTYCQYYAFVNNFITIGELIASIQGSASLMMSIWFMGMAIPELFTNIGICKGAIELINAPIDIEDKPDAIDLVVKKGKIEFKDVVFAYQNNYTIFKNLRVQISPKERVGLVGFSGSGKTTFANLILRYFEIQSGQILIDSQDIKAVKQDSLRQTIAHIPQDPVLFHRTIMENIRYGKLEATDEDVIKAAKKAHCHEFIMKMSEGYNTVVGERGIRLSGGQRQRIAIARAILKDSPIIIMDEATSALDSATERLINLAIDEAIKNKTTIVIAHRLSTLADMDRILVFDHGEIIENGSHEELIAKGGRYKLLWDMQKDGFIPEEVKSEEEDE